MASKQRRFLIFYGSQHFGCDTLVGGFRRRASDARMDCYPHRSHVFLRLTPCEEPPYYRFHQCIQFVFSASHSYHSTTLCSLEPSERFGKSQSANVKGRSYEVAL